MMRDRPHHYCSDEIKHCTNEGCKYCKDAYMEIEKTKCQTKKIIALAVDLETTGFDFAGCDVLVTAFVEILEGYKIGRKKEFYSRPRSTKYFTSGAQEVHGYSYWKASTFPEPKKSCVDMLSWLKMYIKQFPIPFIYHGNRKFDFKFLEWHFRHEEMSGSFNRLFSESRVESTLELAKKNLILDNYKLSTVADYYDIELEHHNALSDAMACAEIWCNIKQRINLNNGSLF